MWWWWCTYKKRRNPPGWRIHWKPSEGNNQTHVSQNFSWQTQTQTKSVFSDTVLRFNRPANDDSCSYLGIGILKFYSLGLMNTLVLGAVTCPLFLLCAGWLAGFPSLDKVVNHSVSAFLPGPPASHPRRERGGVAPSPSHCLASFTKPTIIFIVATVTKNELKTFVVLNLSHRPIS